MDDNGTSEGGTTAGTEIERYIPIYVAFALGGIALVTAMARRPARPADALELVEASFATFFITRVIAREKVGAVVREPFVEPAPGSDPTDLKGDAKQATGSGVRRSIGELVTCPRCLGPWAGAIVTTGRVLAPRQARIVTRILALAGINSMVHAVHAAACSSANRS